MKLPFRCPLNSSQVVSQGWANIDLNQRLMFILKIQDALFARSNKFKQILMPLLSLIKINEYF